MSQPVIPPLGAISTEEFRKRLSGLTDPQDALGMDAKAKVKDLAIRFCAALPQVFGEQLDRTTLWDRIGSGIQSAYAKTAGDDTDFFVSQVLEHIKAEPTKSLSCEELASVLVELSGWTQSERQAWITHLATHLIPTLVFAKAKWEETKKVRKKSKGDKSPNALDSDHITSFIARSKAMRSYTIQCVSEALSPITHMSGTVGNEAIIAREPVATERGLRWLPSLSGNALRHRAVREPGVLWLLEQYGLKGKLNLNQLNFLLHGGNLTESTAFENTRRIADMHRLWPLLKLVGGSLLNQILAGCLDVWRGVLVCEENRAAVNEFSPSGRLYSSESFIASYQYTRGDAKKTGLAQDKETALDDKSNLMIFAGQCVNRGALFLHGFILRHSTDLELGALLWSLRLWQAAGGTIGGQAARGHGRLRCELIDFDRDQEALCQAYCDYALSVKDEAVAWLMEAFAK